MRPATDSGRRNGLSEPWARWGALSSIWGLVSFVLVRLATGRSLSTGEILVWVPACYAFGVVTVFLVSRAKRSAPAADPSQSPPD